MPSPVQNVHQVVDLLVHPLCTVCWYCTSAMHCMYMYILQETDGAIHECTNYTHILETVLVAHVKLLIAVH